MDNRESMPDLAEALRYHGGNLDAARSLFPDAPEPWIDLSTGINPVHYPVADFPIDSLLRLPGSDDLAQLEGIAAAAYRAAPSAAVVAAPGTQAILQWLPRLIPAGRVGILGLTYGEHEICWRAGGSEVTRVETVDALTRCDVGVVVNPNNPDGRLLSATLLRAAAAALAAHDGILIVDEAFMDVVTPPESLAPVLPRNAIVLRSLGKAFGLPGLRLGFAIADAARAVPLRRALGPWAVSGPAIAIGRRALADSAWLAGAVRRLTVEADRLDRVLSKAGFAAAGGTSLFRLAGSAEADEWFDRLARSGILVRPFAGDPGLLRFGIPHWEFEWERLEGALGSSRTIPQG